MFKSKQHTYQSDEEIKMHKDAYKRIFDLNLTLCGHKEQLEVLILTLTLTPNPNPNLT